MKYRLKEWPARCKRDIDHFVKKCKVKCGKDVKKLTSRLSTCRSKQKVLQKANDAHVKKKVRDAYIIGTVVSGALGLTVGVLGTVLVCVFVGG